MIEDDDMPESEEFAEQVAKVMDAKGRATTDALELFRMIDDARRDVEHTQIGRMFIRLLELRRNQMVSFMLQDGEECPETKGKRPEYFYAFGTDHFGLSAHHTNVLEVLHMMLGDKNMDGKECRACKLWKPLIHFSRLKASADGRNARCLQCERERVARFQRRKKAMESRKCGKCGEVKAMCEFGEDRHQPNGKSYYCKECRRKGRP